MIKVLVTLYLSLFFSSNAVAQTIQQTQAWIIKQTEVNPYALKHTIEGDQLISHFDFASGITGEVIQKAIPISQITKISYTHTHEYLSYSMTCGKPCAYLLNDSDQDDEVNEKHTHFLFEIYKNVDKSYVARMNRALIHLVFLHGGKAMIVKTEILKEAF